MQLPEKIKQFTPKLRDGIVTEVIHTPYHPSVAIGELMVKVNEIIDYLAEKEGLRIHQPDQDVSK